MKTSIGLCGATGKTPELQIGQVKTVDYTQKASVEITGTRENPILNFNIPKGKDGAKLIVREYFNGDIQILNNLNELPQNTNSDSYGKTVMSVNGIKQLLEKINDVLTKANANTNAIGSLTSTVQGNKSDIETKLNSFKSDTDTTVQSINQTISELEQTIETKLNEELTKQVKALQDENKKLNDMIFENSLKENFEGSTSSISDTSNGVVRFETIKGQTFHNLINGSPYYTSANTSLFHWELSKNNTEITIKRTQTGDIGWQYIGLSVNTNLLKNDTTYTVIFLASGNCECDNAYVNIMEGSSMNSVGGVNAPRVTGLNKYKFTTDHTTKIQNQILYIGMNNTELPNVDDYMTLSNFILIEGDWNNKEVPSSITGIESTGEKEGNKISVLSKNKDSSKQDKKEILVSLDGGLKSLPNGVSDTIEQKEDGFYLVQRIGKVVLNGVEPWVDSSVKSDNIIRFYFTINDKKLNGYVLSDKFKTAMSRDEYDSDNECCYSDGTFAIGILKSKLSEVNSNGFKQWLQANPVTIYYELNAIIETKLDINNLNLKTFKDLTYITSENSIKPVLKGQATKDITTVIKNLQSKGAN